MSEAKERIEAALVQARQNLEEAFYELEKLPAFSQSSVGFAAHALNNFLAITSGTVELLLLSLADHPDPQVRIWLEGLLRGTDMMTHTVSQLGANSAGQEFRLRLEKVDLPMMAQRFCSFYQRSAGKKQIHIVSGSTVDVPPAWTDRVLLAAVLDNVFSNAVKFSPPGKRVWVQVYEDQAGVVCRVRDEGPGLSAEDQARLFQRGARLTPQPTGGEPSSGYGLAVAKEFVERLGGMIWCESVLGQGACFSVRLPLSQEQWAMGEHSEAGLPGSAVL